MWEVIIVTGYEKTYMGYQLNNIVLSNIEYLGYWGVGSPKGTSFEDKILSSHRLHSYNHYPLYKVHHRHYIHPLLKSNK